MPAPSALPDAEAFLHKRVRLGRRLHDVYAPHGDPFLKLFGRGARYRDFARFARALLRPGDAVMDIGANIGITALIAADAIGPGGRLVAVEGSPTNGRALARTLAANDIGNAVVEICAVGARSGESAFHEASAYGFVREETNLLAGHATVSVPMRTIDALAADAALPRLDLLKLDIEGYEWEALQGAAETLARHDPVVFLEFNSWCQIVFYDRNPRGFLTFLFDSFAELHVWQTGRLVSVRDLGPVEFLRRHLTETGCISDLVAARSADRIEGLRDLSRGPWRAMLRRRPRRTNPAES